MGECKRIYLPGPNNILLPNPDSGDSNDANSNKGGLIGIFFAWILEQSDAKRYYIFSDTPSNKAVCSRPKDTQFKCTVSRNGELIRDTSKDVSSDD